MKNGLILIMSVIFLLNQSFLRQFAFSEEVLPIKMEFYDAVKYSLEHNNNLKAMKHDLSAKEKDIGIARSEIMPKVRFLEEFDVTDNPTQALGIKLNQASTVAKDFTLDTINNPSTVTNFLTAGIVEQSIYNRKSLIAIKMAKKEYSSSGYFYIRKQEDIVNQVAQACIAITTNQDLIKVIEEEIKDAKTHQQMAEVRSKSDPRLYSDVLRAKSAVDEMEEKLIGTKRNLIVSKRKLGFILGIANNVEISNSLPEIKLKDVNYYYDIAAYRNDIKATEIEVENAKNKIKSEQAAWYPTMNAIASYNFYNSSFPFGSEDSSYIVGAFFRWDAFDGNKRKYEISKAKYKEAEAKEYLTGLKLAVNFRVFEVYSNIESLQKKLELAIAAKELAEEDTALVLKNWQNSFLPFVSLTDAQINLNEAREKVVRTRNELRAAMINLSFESGIISQELLQ